MVALDEESGEVLWQTFTVPRTAASRVDIAVTRSGSRPRSIRSAVALRRDRQQLHRSPEVEACHDANPLAECAAPDDFFDTALALDLKTGKVKWAKRLQGLDVFNIACLLPTGRRRTAPPRQPGLRSWRVRTESDGKHRRLGQKSGIYWALKCRQRQHRLEHAGRSRRPCRRDPMGDRDRRQRIYVAVSNSLHMPYTLVPSGQTINWGAWSALDVATGKILWQTADRLRARWTSAR